MKLYLIAILLACLGLWISSEVRADGRCGLRTSHVLGVDSWQAKRGLGDEIHFMVTIRSNDEKAIRSVGGTIELFFEGRSVASPQIMLDQPLAAHGQSTLYLSYPVTRDSGKLIDPEIGKLTALACIASIDYVDGSGVIVN